MPKQKGGQCSKRGIINLLSLKYIGRQGLDKEAYNWVE